MLQDAEGVLKAVHKKSGLSNYKSPSTRSGGG